MYQRIFLVEILVGAGFNSSIKLMGFFLLYLNKFDLNELSDLDVFTKRSCHEQCRGRGNLLIKNYR